MMTDVDFDIVWDGSHRDCDADLLSAGVARVAEKRVGAHGPLRPRTDNTALVVAALTLAAPLTMAELARVPGIGHSRANAGLFYLGKAGRLGRRERPGTWASRLRRPVWEYWLKQRGEPA